MKFDNFKNRSKFLTSHIRIKHQLVIRGWCEIIYRCNFFPIELALKFFKILHYPTRPEISKKRTQPPSGILPFSRYTKEPEQIYWIDMNHTTWIQFDSFSFVLILLAPTQKERLLWWLRFLKVTLNFASFVWRKFQKW